MRLLYVCRYVFIIFFMMFIVSVNAMAADISISGLLTAGGGFLDNPFFDPYVKEAVNKTIENGYVITKTKKLITSPATVGVHFDFRTFFDDFGLSVSAGVDTLLNRLEIRYKLPADTTYKSKIFMNTYLIPINIDLIYRFNLHEIVRLNLGVGPGYYLNYADFSHKARASVNYSNYKNIRNHKHLDHSVGLRAFVEVEVKVMKNFSVVVGARGDCIFSNIKTIPAVQGYVGVQEGFSIRK